MDGITEVKGEQQQEKSASFAHICLGLVHSLCIHGNNVSTVGSNPYSADQCYPIYRL